MATITNKRRTILRTNILFRNRLFALAVLLTTSSARLVGTPGLKQSARVMRGIVDAVKAPNHLSAQAQEQINRIDKTIATITSNVKHIDLDIEYPDIHARCLIKAQGFIDTLEALRVNLAEIKGMVYKRRFFYQEKIIQDLDDYDQAFQEANREFLVYVRPLVFIVSCIKQFINPG
ncbi:unnamed protein product [Rhizoctonia solani]|uniref:Uncharacterized protein n=1 Tax=Rhizoctonia solani TaxID=456999 RepID=A0A8H3AWJ9_9AGAM|nr:unnamed protein product [Rhizoctonia solani]